MPHKSNTLHYSTFHSHIEVVDYCSWTLCTDETLIEILDQKDGPELRLLSTKISERLTAEIE